MHKDGLQDKYIYIIALIMVLLGIISSSVAMLSVKENSWAGNQNKEEAEPKGETLENGSTEAVDSRNAYTKYNRELVNSFLYEGHEVSNYKAIGAIRSAEEVDVEKALKTAKHWVEDASDNEIASFPIMICYYWDESERGYEICFDDPESYWIDYTVLIDAGTGQIEVYFNMTQEKIPEAEMGWYDIVIKEDIPQEKKAALKAEYTGLAQTMVKTHFPELEIAEYIGWYAESQGFVEEDANYYILYVGCVLSDGSEVIFGFNQVDKSLCFFSRGE